jgi:hypothetical protein
MIFQDGFKRFQDRWFERFQDSLKDYVSPNSQKERCENEGDEVIESKRQT